MPDDLRSAAGGARTATLAIPDRRLGPAAGPPAPTGFEPISAAEREHFHEQGFLLLRGVLNTPQRAALEAAMDRVHAEETAAGRVRPDGSVHLLGFITRDEVFASLLAHPMTFPYVWGLAGWNVYSHHNHLDVTPPSPEPGTPRWGWHQDGYRQNSDPEGPDPLVPRPMLSLKIAYVISDLSQSGRGATKVIPGSHRRNTLPRPDDLTLHHPDPDGAVEIVAEPGDAFVFDRRLWHSRSPNRSDVTRKLLFVGYTYRWIRALDEMPVDRATHWWARRSPVERQILGAGPHTLNYWGVDVNGAVDDSIPLRAELKRRGLLDPSLPWLR